MSQRRRLVNQINVVPYIDVMLVLLVIFMVTAPMVPTSSVELPSVGQAPQPPKVDAITLTLSKDESAQGNGLVYRIRENNAERTINGTGELARALQTVLSESGENKPPVVIAADKNVMYNDVISMLDSVRQAGFDKVSLLTQSTATK